MKKQGPLRVLMVEARFYNDILDALAEGAVAALEAAGVETERLAVPGALEIPAAIRLAMAAGYDGYVALGCVIRGETSHYDIVANESARALQTLAIEHELAIGNGILTVENHAQALDRALPDRKNKGAEAAEACLTMIAIKRRFYPV